MTAVLVDAIRCLTGRVGAGPDRAETMREARAWVADDDLSWPFSFENICDVLDIDGDYLRRGLHAWRERARGGRRDNVVEIAATDRAELRKASGD